MPSSALHDTPARCVLLLLDTQIAPLSDPPRGVPSAPMIRHNISRILSQARSAKPPPLVIHIRNCGEFGEQDEPNTPGWQLMFPPLVSIAVISMYPISSDSRVYIHHPRKMNLLSTKIKTMHSLARSWETLSHPKRRLSSSGCKAIFA